MRHLSQYLNEVQDYIGNELKVGDMIQFKSSGIMLWGEITEITNDERSKFIVKTLGWFGDKTLRSKVKEQYKVNVSSTSVYKVNLVKR